MSNSKIWWLGGKRRGSDKVREMSGLVPSFWSCESGLCPGWLCCGGRNQHSTLRPTVSSVLGSVSSWVWTLPGVTPPWPHSLVDWSSDHCLNVNMVQQITYTINFQIKKLSWLMNLRTVHRHFNLAEKIEKIGCLAIYCLCHGSLVRQRYVYYDHRQRAKQREVNIKNCNCFRW